MHISFIYQICEIAKVFGKLISRYTKNSPVKTCSICLKLNLFTCISQEGGIENNKSNNSPLKLM